MLSPGQRHRLNVEMRQKIEKQQAVAIADGESMHLQARAVDRDAARLKGLTMAERTEIKKREFLPNYLPTAQRYLDEGKVYKNPIFSYCVVWLFDTGDFQQGLDWARPCHTFGVRHVTGADVQTLGLRGQCGGGNIKNTQ